MATTWSAQQTEIFNWFETGKGHLVVRARAGCGKTTTLMEGVSRAPEKNVLVAAFSKIIATELQTRIDSNGRGGVFAKTLHAVGFAAVRMFRDRIKISNDRADVLASKVCGVKTPDAITRLVSKLHTKGREIAPHATKLGDLTNIAYQFDCVPEEQWESMGFGVSFVEQKALEAMELAADVKAGDSIDYSDMIFLPLRNGWLTPQFDLVVVDEAQDMTVSQLEIAQGVLRQGGRMAVIGDDRQAIFAFRGADTGSLDRLKTELGAVELGLKTTYRCARAIVNLAAGYVPDFEAGETNPDGIVDTINSANLVAAASAGDFILSRVNAPLVSMAMQLLRSGKRARVAGQDIGKGLVSLLRKLKAKSVPDLLTKIERNAAKEVNRYQAQLKGATNGRKTAIQSKIEAIQDQADMLTSLCDGAKNVSDVEHRVETLFTDDGLGAAGLITCSSVHRAKGLESNRVFILKSTLRGGNAEEDNIAYVAITRAKQHLTWVSDEAAA